MKLSTDGTGALNATPITVRDAINANAGTIVTATATGTATVDPLALTQIPAGSRTLVVSATSSKPLVTVDNTKIGYDGNNDGFDDGLGAPAVGNFVPGVTGDSTFTLTFILGVGTLPPAPTSGAAFVAGTSSLRLAAEALIDTTAVKSQVQIVTITA